MSDKTEKSLFNEFPPVSSKEWMERITVDLKGADFEKKLVWKSQEGFKVQPFYRKDDLKELNYLNSLPGEFPYVRGINNYNKWLIRQDLKIENVLRDNKKALNLLTKGVNSLGFIIENKTLLSEKNISILLKDIPLDKIEINFTLPNNNYFELSKWLINIFNLNSNPDTIKASLDYDPLGTLTRKGKLTKPLDELLEKAAKIAIEAKAYKNFQSISVNGRYFGNSGSTIVQELAFSLSAGNEYLSLLKNKGLSTDDAANSIRFNLSVGSNYFMEIAKLRAARILWASIVDAYKPETLESCKMIVHCESSEFNKTIFDPYVNLLRTQTEAMSATIGGCHSLTIQAFDNSYRTPDEFSERIARNQQLLLKEEAYFDMTTDASAGSYYIETLTDSIADEAWKLFVETEEKGGFTSALKKGFIQTKIKESAQAKQEAIAQRKMILVGTNQFPDLSEKMTDSIEKSAKKLPSIDSFDVEPLHLFRVADQFEALRLTTEKSEKRPKVFMLTFGNLAMRLARSQFSANFFGCAGYEIIDNPGFENIEEGINAALKAESDIVVLCSSDNEYTEAAPEAHKLIDNKAIIVVAGAPANMDELKSKGIEHFIHIRSNVLETLQTFNKALNI